MSTAGTRFGSPDGLGLPSPRALTVVHVLIRGGGNCHPGSTQESVEDQIVWKIKGTSFKNYNVGFLLLFLRILGMVWNWVVSQRVFVGIKGEICPLCLFVLFCYVVPQISSLPPPHCSDMMVLILWWSVCRAVGIFTKYGHSVPMFAQLVVWKLYISDRGALYLSRNPRGCGMDTLAENLDTNYILFSLRSKPWSLGGPSHLHPSAVKNVYRRLFPASSSTSWQPVHGPVSLSWWRPTVYFQTWDEPLSDFVGSPAHSVLSINFCFSSMEETKIRGYIRQRRMGSCPY